MATFCRMVVWSCLFLWLNQYENTLISGLELECMEMIDISEINLMNENDH
jgi:hypothetical protein